MKRLFWLGLGAATGVVVTRKVAEASKKFTPAGVGEQVGGGLREIAAAIGSFGAEVRAGMTEREHELTDIVEQRSGQRLPGMSDAVFTTTPATGRAAVTARRAPGAGGRA